MRVGHVPEHHSHTEDLVADIVFFDEISEEFLIHSGLVEYLNETHWRSFGFKKQPQRLSAGCSTYCRIPKGAPQLERFQQYRLGFFETEVRTESKTQAHRSKAWSWYLDVAKRKCFDHFVQSVELCALWRK